MPATLTETESGLLRAIIDRPDDDGPRLVLADYLDDIGECRRAAFIRRQVENARADQGRSFVRFGGGGCPWTGDLESLANVKPWEWVKENHVTPVLAFAGGSSGLERCVAWHRGFPAVVGCTERRWHEWHDHPTFRGVPIEAVCFIGQRGGIWGTAGVTRGVEEFQSMVRPGVVARVKAGWRGWEQRTQAAFPNVRWQTGRCSSWLLTTLALGDLRAWLASVYDEEEAAD